MRCSYPAQPDRWAGSYLVVIDHASHAQQAASWKPVPGVESTDLTRADIAQIEVRTSRGQPVLRLST